MSQAERWVGERARVRNRKTHTTVVLVDTLEEPQWMDSEPGRWATVCDEHANLVNHLTLSVARAWLHFPQGWCEACMALVYNEAPDPTR